MCIYKEGMYKEMSIHKDFKAMGQEWCNIECEYANAQKELQEQIEKLLELKEKRKKVNAIIDRALKGKFPEYRQAYDPRIYDSQRYEKLPDKVIVKYRIIEAHRALALI